MFHAVSSLLLAAQALACSQNAPAHPASDGFSYAATCACADGAPPGQAGRWSLVEASKPIQKMYKFVSANMNQILPVYSCFRSQADQDQILKANHCAPNYGNAQCSGRIAANISEHTIGTAGDFFIKGLDGDPSALCRLLDKARKVGNNGHGGITYYGTDKKTGLSGFHFDVKEDWCNWGACEQVLGEGYCRRTKFREKEAKIEDALAAAKLQNSKTAVTRLQAALKQLEAQCPPDDAACRDSFKTPLPDGS